MQLLDYIWLDVIVATIGLVAVNSAISGELYSYGRGGGRKLIFRTSSGWARLFSAACGLSEIAWVIVDLRRKFPPQ
jgi:hypothetical protein